MKQIKLTRGQFALVDTEDYNKLNQYNWYAQYDEKLNSFYAARHITVSKNKREQIRMHCVIMNTHKKLEVDHINHNTLDNRKSNLRVCTHQQNCMNQLKCKNSSSKHKGVNWDAYHKKWHVRIQNNGKSCHLGFFTSEIKAACVYNIAAKILFGKYARLNNCRNIIDSQFKDMIKEKIQCKKNKK